MVVTAQVCENAVCCKRSCTKKLDWYVDAVFYHIFPLGFLDCESVNPQNYVTTHRFLRLLELIPYWHGLGITAVLLGPVFRSVRHGYDTLDYYHVDERLGDDSDLGCFVESCHRYGIRVVLDGVFNHVGRAFWAFRDVKEKRMESRYVGWFKGLRFNCNNRYNDGFCYDSWEGHEELVLLNLEHPEVRGHLLGAVKEWIERFQIDGLRLDAANCLSLDFIRALRSFCLSKRDDFYLMGEVIHGDYRTWANPEMLHGTTNYEIYKGLWSSHNDANYHEVAYSLRRQFDSKSGIYTDLAHFQFVDNHDVVRAASVLRNITHIFPLYAMLFTIPGTPSIYYGSEWGCLGTKGVGFDADKAIRPAFSNDQLSRGEIPNTVSWRYDLWMALKRLIGLRQNLVALRRGSYEQLLVESQLLAFRRCYKHESAICIITSESNSRMIQLQVDSGLYKDILNDGIYESKNNILTLPTCPLWVRVLVKI